MILADNMMLKPKRLLDLVYDLRHYFGGTATSSLEGERKQGKPKITGTGTRPWLRLTILSDNLAFHLLKDCMSESGAFGIAEHLHRFVIQKAQQGTAGLTHSLNMRAHTTKTTINHHSITLTTTP